MPKYIDITGKRFGKLLAVQYHDSVTRDRKRNRVVERWLCRCDCGNECIKGKWDLNRGHIKSCGCLKKESNRKAGLKRRKKSNSDILKTTLWNRFRIGAKNRGIEFDLSHDQVYDLCMKDCVYCGDSGSNFTQIRNRDAIMYHNGIDRLDNSKGYTEENVLPCCSICNYAKSDFSQEDFLSWLRRIAKWQYQTNSLVLN